MLSQHSQFLHGLIVAVCLVSEACGFSIESPPPDDASVPDVYDVCEPEDCGPYVELRPCPDGGTSLRDNCTFVPDRGCEWVPVLCSSGR